MDTELTCSGCGNRCLIPPSAERDYACPRCARLLPRYDRNRGQRASIRARLGLGAQAGYLLLLAALFGAVVYWAWGGPLAGRSTMAASQGLPRRAVYASLTEAEQRNYDYRLHQLGEDLRRDGTDFEVLRRLGQLHLRLAASRTEGRGMHLRRARYYLRLAADMALTNREAQMVRGMLNAANSPNPSLDVFAMMMDLGSPPHLDEDMVRARVGWLEEQAGTHPNNARLLYRLGDSYTSLYELLAHGGGGHGNRWPGASDINDPAEARRLAELNYDRAVKCATTHEAKSRALYGSSQLYRALNEPDRAADALRKVLELQPNHWFAALELASLCRQLRHPDEATRLEALSVKWRTPGWI